MKLPVFLSWGGQRSKAIASLLHAFLPQVIQAVRPWMSQRDIAAGAQWQAKLAGALKDSGFGLLVVTREAMQSHFVTFEAGALWKALPENQVCPVLFDGLKPSDIGAPLSIFQMKTGTDRGDMLSLVQSINQVLKEESRLEAAVLEQAFARVWPELEKSLQAIPEEKPAKGAAAPAQGRNDSDKLEEILSLLRGLDRRVPTGVLSGLAKGAYANPTEIPTYQSEGERELAAALMKPWEDAQRAAAEALKPYEDLRRAAAEAVKPYEDLQRAAAEGLRNLGVTVTPSSASRKVTTKPTDPKS